MDENIVGKKYNHWTVVALVESSGSDKKIECVCDCGTRRIVSKKNIVFCKKQLIYEKTYDKLIQTIIKGDTNYVLS